MPFEKHYYSVFVFRWHPKFSKSNFSNGRIEDIVWQITCKNQPEKLTNRQRAEISTGWIEIIRASNGLSILLCQSLQNDSSLGITNYSHLFREYNHGVQKNEECRIDLCGFWVDEWELQFIQGTILMFNVTM
jgi:hypothetical protein